MMKRELVVLVVVSLAMVEFMAEPTTAVTCLQVDAALATCIPYFTQGGTPQRPCCVGLKSFLDTLKTKEDRQTACNCGKQTAGRYQTIRDDVAAALPQKCGISIGFPITRNMDCSRIP